MFILLWNNCNTLSPPIYNLCMINTAIIYQELELFITVWKIKPEQTCCWIVLFVHYFPWLGTTKKKKKQKKRCHTHPQEKKKNKKQKPEFSFIHRLNPWKICSLTEECSDHKVFGSMGLFIHFSYFLWIRSFTSTMTDERAAWRPPLTRDCHSPCPALAVFWKSTCI